MIVYSVNCILFSNFCSCSKGLRHLCLCVCMSCLVILLVFFNNLSWRVPLSLKIRRPTWLQELVKCPDVAYCCCPGISWSVLHGRWRENSYEKTTAVTVLWQSIHSIIYLRSAQTLLWGLGSMLLLLTYCKQKAETNEYRVY